MLPKQSNRHPLNERGNPPGRLEPGQLAGFQVPFFAKTVLGTLDSRFF